MKEKWRCKGWADHPDRSQLSRESNEGTERQGIKVKGIFLLIVTLLALSCSSSGAKTQFTAKEMDRCTDAIEVTRKVVEDYYWWNGKLPASYSTVASSVSGFPKEWQPLPGSIITWKQVKAELGKSSLCLQLSLSVRNYTESKKVFIAIDKKGARYRPHYTYMQSGRFGDLADTEENFAISIAWAICELIYNDKRTPVSWSDLLNSSLGNSLGDLRKGRTVSFKVLPKTIEVVVTSKKYTFAKRPPEF